MGAGTWWVVWGSALGREEEFRWDRKGEQEGELLRLSH